MIPENKKDLESFSSLIPAAWFWSIDTVRRTMYVELEKSLLRNTLCPGNWLFVDFARASGDKCAETLNNSRD